MKIKAGDVFTTREGGSVTVIGYRGCRTVLIKHNDSHGHESSTAVSSLRTGSIKNPYHPSVFGVGFIGVGEHPVSVAGKPTKSYQAWRTMLRLSYDPVIQTRLPSYIGCTVHPDWHNYQNFAEWYERQYRAEGWELGKGLIIEGNKLYSADTCVFVPQALNSLLNDSGDSRGDLPQGVSRYRNRYQAQLTVDGKAHYLGYYSTPEEAFQAYKLAKEANVKRMAEQYMYLIDPRVYSTLINYTVKP